MCVINIQCVMYLNKIVMFVYFFFLRNSVEDDENDPNMWTCERKGNSTSLLDSASSLISEAKKNYPSKFDHFNIL